MEDLNLPIGGKFLFVSLSIGGGSAFLLVDNFLCQLPIHGGPEPFN